MTTKIIDSDIEVFELKGLGHPDMICNMLAEALANKLEQEYMKYYGRIFPYNLDKIMLVAGKSKIKFGGGKILEPIEIIIGDKATKTEHWDKIEKSLEEEIYKWFENNLRFVKREYIKPIFKLKETSLNLQRQFYRCNDTVAISSHRDTPLESFIKKLEKFILSLREIFPFIGEDSKFLAIRYSRKLILRISIAFVDKFIFSVEDYKRKINVLIEYLKSRVKGIYDLESIKINPEFDGTKETIYLTVTGTSAECGDSGQTGRTNYESVYGKSSLHPTKKFRKYTRNGEIVVSCIGKKEPEFILKVKK